jgi:CRISPR type I-E-associated protein CasB/Cse2
MQQPETQSPATAPGSLSDNNGWTGLVEAFAGAVRALDSAERRGDIASLRRLNTDTPDAATFFRIVVKITPEAGPSALQRYARFLQILAMKPAALTSGSFGAAMAAAGVSEARAQKLLTARGPALAQQLRLISRRLANEGTLPYRQIGDLLLIEDEDSKHAEAIRLRIARDYWRTLDRAEANPPSPES